MVLESGHREDICVVIPTRKLNDITLENIRLFSIYFIKKGLKFQIIVVSNNDSEKKYPNFHVYLSSIKNAAISRNLGIQNSSINTGTFIYLDDDIILDEINLNKYLELVFAENNKSILAPYITGHVIEENYRFSKLLVKYYTWISRSRVFDYNDIQGKSLYSFCFPPVFSRNFNSVEWIPGGFMTFRRFDKSDVLFDLSLFGKNYYMEDYYLSNKNFLAGIPISMLPIIFEHKINYDKFDNNFKKKFKEICRVEMNRLKIHRIRSKITKESVLRFKTILLLNYLYKLKAFRIRDFASLSAVIYLLLCNPKK